MSSGPTGESNARMVEAHAGRGALCEHPDRNAQIGSASKRNAVRRFIQNIITYRVAAVRRAEH